MQDSRQQNFGGISGFTKGVKAFPAGIGFLLKNPKYIPIVIIPFCLTLILFCCIIYFGSDYFNEYLTSWVPSEDAWYFKYGLKYVFWLIYALVAVIFAFFGFVTIGSIITSPFSDYLSLKVEISLLPEHMLAPPESFLKSLFRTVKQEFLRISILISLYLLLVPFLFVPIFGPAIFAFGTMVVSIRYLAWDGLDYSMARRALGFRQKMLFLKDNRCASLGYGSISYLLLLIPLTTLFVLPVNAIGGSILFCKLAINGHSDHILKGPSAS